MERATEKPASRTRKVSLDGRPFPIEGPFSPVAMARAIRRRAKPSLADKKARLDALARQHGF